MTESSTDKIRELENSLLPPSRRDSMGPILNHVLASEYDSNESRVSRRSSLGNKKNDSTVQFGDGHNFFSAK